jgi:hypothetical protein
MTAPAMSHLICSIALVALILLLPGFFATKRDNIAEEMAKAELTEISDYASNTLENLYLLANSTNEDLTLTKDLINMPLTVQDSFYTLRIVSVDNVTAYRVTAFLNDKPWVESSSWIVPGLRITVKNSIDIQTTATVEVGCERRADNFYIWIEGE